MNKAQSKEVETSIKLSKNFRVQILKNFEKIENLLEEEEDKTLEINLTKNAIDKYYNRMIDVDIEIQEKLIIYNAAKKVQKDFEDQKGEFEKEYFLKSSLVAKSPNKNINENPLERAEGEGNFTNQNTLIKLPELKLKPFSGDYKDWCPFWQAFSCSIEKNESLSPVIKLTYLKSLLTDKALRLVDSIPTTGEGYCAAVDILKSRFDRIKVSSTESVHRLFSIVDNIKFINKQNMQVIYDDLLCETIKLKHQNVPEEVYSQSVLFKLIPKLPEYLQNKIVTDPTKYSLQDVLELIAGCIDLETAKNSYKIPNDEKKTVFKSQSRNSNPQNNQNTTLLTDNRMKCFICDKDHVYFKCPLPLQTKINIIKNKKLCFKCCRSNHSAPNCRSPVNCLNCKGLHNTSLCEQRRESSTSYVVSESPAARDSNITLDVASPEFVPGNVLFNKQNILKENQHVLLQTALVDVKNSNTSEVFHKARVLFDSGSQRSYITKSLAAKLKLPVKRSETMIVNTFGDDKSQQLNTDVVEFHISAHKFSKGIVARTTETICSPLSNTPVPKKYLPELQCLKLADPDVLYAGQLKIDILLGGDYFWDFICGTICKTEFGPTAINSPVGVILSGNCNTYNEKNIYHTNFISQRNVSTEISNDILSEQVNKLWEVDNLGISLQETDCSPVLTQFEKGLIFDENERRYQSKLLFKNETRPINDNKPLALQRLKGLLKKLEQSQDRLKLFQATFDEQEKCGIISKVNPADYDKCECYYIPFRGVYKESSESTKLRIVYDGSAKMKQCFSLNDLLNTGPCLLNNLCGMLLNFRVFPIIIVGDIVKAYHNISITPAERDYTRFLWRENGDPNADLIIYKFNRIPFGLASSQFILNATLRYHILKQSNLHPVLAEKLANSFYSDNLIFGCLSESEAQTALFSINDMHKEINFPLSKWNSNSQLLKKCFFEIDVSHVEKNVENILGLIWDTDNDTIGFNLNNLLIELETYVGEKPPVPTKRLILSYISSVFDPMGYLVPVLLFSKHLFQSLCIAKLDWDQEISESQFHDFLQWIKLVKAVSNVKIDRCLPMPRDAKFSLRGFCDASTKCYAACVYLLIHDNNTPVAAQLLICKGRIPPIKPLSIPKLELLAALLLVRLVKSVISFMPNVSFQKIEYFTDSSTVLYWLNKNIKDWNSFVIRRVNEITETSDVNNWGYVPSHLNLADLPSRGIELNNLHLLHKWYIYNDVSELNMNVSSYPWNEANLSKCDLVQEAETSTLIASVNKCCVGSIINISRFSTYRKLINVTCLVLKFLKLCRKQPVVDLKKNAEILWIKSVQKNMLAPVSSGGNVRSSPYFSQFNLFKDENGIFRCKTRLGHAQVTYNFKFPILLDRNSLFTKLLVLDFHVRLLHAGSQQMLLLIRETYWIPKVRKLVLSVIKFCVRCQKVLKPTFENVIMPDLPEFRLEEAPPFTHVGVDFCGHFLVKFPNLIDNKLVPFLKKVYVCVFSCAVTRAVHLELTFGMTCDDFIRCFRRFVSKYNIPHIVYSDNFSTFKKSDRDLHVIITHPRFKDYFESINVQWKYATPLGPWTHGFTERLIAVVKCSLKKVLYKALVEIDEFITVLTESQAIINNRPLTYNSADLDNEASITPNVLLHGRNLCQLPPLNVKFSQEYPDNGFVTKRLKYLERLRINFWNAFHKEYLSTLSERHFRLKQKDSTLEIKEGCICLLKDKDQPRLKWTLVKILRVLPCRDSRVRSVEILYVNKGDGRVITKRPISLLVPLELDLKLSEL